LPNRECHHEISFRTREGFAGDRSARGGTPSPGRPMKSCCGPSLLSMRTTDFTSGDRHGGRPSWRNRHGCRWSGATPGEIISSSLPRARFPSRRRPTRPWRKSSRWAFPDLSSTERITPDPASFLRIRTGGYPQRPQRASVLFQFLILAFGSPYLSNPQKRICHNIKIIGPQRLARLIDKKIVLDH
jgi:hypothetical protein